MNGLQGGSRLTHVLLSGECLELIKLQRTFPHLAGIGEYVHQLQRFRE